MKPLNDRKQIKMNLFEAKNLSVSVGDKIILKSLNLSIAAGEIQALLGPNGSGKSSLAHTVIGYPQYNVTGGEIIYKDQFINDWPPEKRSLAGLMITHQIPVNIPGVSVGEYLRLTTSKHHPAPGFRQKLRDVLQKVGLGDDFASRDLDSGISGGERKRLEIATVLLHQPEFLILDEIDSGLDVDALKTLSQILKQYLNGNRSILVISHQEKILEILKPDKAQLISNG